MTPILQLKYFFEKHGFHVSSRLADTLGMLCGKCTLVCPRDIQLRNVVMNIKRNILKYKMILL